MSMHLMPVYVTSTNMKKRKVKKSKKQEASDAAHAKFLKKMGYKGSRSLTVKHRAYTPQVSRLESDLGSNPSGTTNSRSVGKSGNPPHLGCGNRRFESSCSDQCFYDTSMAKKEPNVYNGKRKLIGIATLHKSNMVPVFSQEDAEEIAKMRRG